MTSKRLLPCPVQDCPAAELQILRFAQNDILLRICVVALAFMGVTVDCCLRFSSFIHRGTRDLTSFSMVRPWTTMEKTTAT